MPADLLDAYFSNYAAYEYAVASTQLFLAMLGMGALLTPRDFLLEVKRPQGLVTGLSCQWLLAPLVAFVLGIVLPIPAGIAAGLVLVAAVPGGTSSNILTLFGRGNIALSVSLTSITTVAALFVTPLLLQLLISKYLPADFEMPTGRIALDIFATLIVPLLLGMAVRWRGGTSCSVPVSRWAIRLSLATLAVMVVGATGSGRLDPQAHGLMGIAALVMLCVCLQGGAFVCCRAMGLTTNDSLAIVIETGFRNVSLAVAIKALVFPASGTTLDPIGDAVLYAILLYGGVSMALCVIPVIANRRSARPVPA